MKTETKAILTAIEKAITESYDVKEISMLTYVKHDIEQFYRNQTEIHQNLNVVDDLFKTLSDAFNPNK